MIFAIFGMGEFSFDRLLNKLEKYHLRTKKDIFAQIGNTKNKNKIIKSIDFLSYDLVIKYISKAEVVITHGGAGSIKDCLTLNAKTIAFPRSIEFGECQHNQSELVEKLHKQKKLINASNFDTLEDAIIQAKNIDKFLNPSNELTENINLLLKKIIR